MASSEFILSRLFTCALGVLMRHAKWKMKSSANALSVDSLSIGSVVEIARVTCGHKIKLSAGDALLR
ncbi:hypothetical protein GCM10023333_35080 [Ferrimonas pelagia]|uniref:Uncharacterized protein n=2 Tax=Ferrimonas pelagia TaxID=1177826 RepID=A0ABP9FCN8_9GAMM